MTRSHLVRLGRLGTLALTGLLLPATTWAESELSAGDTAWMLTATGLVLLMTLPGLALFYGGMVRSKNVLSVLMQCFATAAMMTVLWMLYGYSLAFSGAGPWIGGLERLGLSGMTPDSLSGTVPESVFMVFQMTFAIITPALIAGALAERVRFSALLVFLALWFSVVYVPVCHWVWGEGGWLGGRGILDFAGGTVVHVNAGIAGLVAALVIGRRQGYPETSMAPNNLGYTVMGASLLWVGWFGFNAGSSLAADGTAGMAMAVTQIATAGAALVWMGCEWLRHGKPTVLGTVSGAIGGLVAITPAAGSVGPVGALFIGGIAAAACFFACVWLKPKLRYDDTLDVFGLHAIGGIVGALLTGVFADPRLGGFGFGDGIDSIGGQLLVQALGLTATVLYCGVLSLVLLQVTKFICGDLRVDAEQESEGLDIVLHDERGYNL